MWLCSETLTSGNCQGELRKAHRKFARAEIVAVFFLSTVNIAQWTTSPVLSSTSTVSISTLPQAAWIALGTDIPENLVFPHFATAKGSKRKVRGTAKRLLRAREDGDAAARASPVTAPEIWVPRATQLANSSVAQAITHEAGKGERAAVAEEHSADSVNLPRILGRYHTLTRLLTGLGGRSASAREIQEARTLVDSVSTELREAYSRVLTHARQLPNKRAALGRAKGAQEGGTPIISFKSFNKSIPLPAAADYQPPSRAVREAAALLAEHDALNGHINYTLPRTVSRRAVNASTTYWLDQIKPHGKSPFNPDPNYKVSDTNVLLPP